MLARFWDEEHGGFFDTASDHADQALIVRPKGITDSAIPSGNAVAAAVLLDLAILDEPPDGAGTAGPIMTAPSRRCVCWAGRWPVTRAPLARL
jgi:uncharacterized protein YyaL (SSP411 family)